MICACGAMILCALRLKFKKRRSQMIDDIKRAVDVRDQLPLVCAGSQKILKKFATGAIDFEEAHDCVLEGGGDSSHLKRVTAFRKWIVSEKAEPMLLAKGQAKDKILFELNKIHSRVEALQKKLTNKE